jgi:hypothetical protein
MLIRKIRFLVLCLLTVMLVHCGAINDLTGNSQFTNKLEAPAFTSELYGSQARVLTVTQPEVGHISWIGFVQSNDYKYFKITKLQSGSTVIRSEGKNFVDSTNSQQTYTPSSSTIVEDIDVGSTTGDTNGFSNGQISIAGGSDLKITVEYAPMVPISNEETPHTAYLIIYYDSPNEGAARIKLTGFTKGVKDEKCAQDPATMDLSTYDFVDDKFDFYFCGSQVKAKGQANMDPASPDFRTDATNLTEVSTLDVTTGDPQSVTFYQVDDSTVCLLSDKLSGAGSSIPDFRFFIPAGLAPVDYIDLSMVEGSYAECTLDSGTITCPDDILIDTLVSVSGLTLTNGTISAEDTTTTECAGFGELQGSGSFGDDDLSLVLAGTILSDANTEEFKIVDSLVAAQITLKKH